MLRTVTLWVLLIAGLGAVSAAYAIQHGIRRPVDLTDREVELVGRGAIVVGVLGIALAVIAGTQLLSGGTS